MYKILLVEDDIDYGQVMQQYLEICGFQVQWLNTPENIKQVLVDTKFDLIILDIMLPVQDGFSLSKKIKEEHPDIPFLFLTAKNQNIDRIMGLKLGAQDYVDKTADPEELKIRINNILSRTAKTTNKTIAIVSYTLYPEQLKLTHKNNTYRLTERERDLILLLIEHNNTIITKEEILKKLWPSTDYFSSRSLDVFMTRLRQYFINDDNIQIISIRGVGYEIKL